MVSRECKEFLRDLFAGLGAVRLRRMFNFDGLFCDDTMFGVVMGDRVFLKTDARTRKDFEVENSGPFTWRAQNGREIVTSYFELPARLLDEPEEAVRWARRAYDIALGSPTALGKRRRKTASPRQPPRRRTPS